jgi:hypothetical protein
MVSSISFCGQCLRIRAETRVESRLDLSRFHRENMRQQITAHALIHHPLGEIVNVAEKAPTPSGANP